MLSPPVDVFGVIMGFRLFGVVDPILVFQYGSNSDSTN